MRFKQNDFDDKVFRPNFYKPWILRDGTVPAPLHQTNPRTVLGRKWWDIERKRAYQKNKDCCWACGRHKMRVKGSLKRLEAHERYTYDYAKGRAYYKESCALCPYCHGFIHSGRLLMLWEEGEETKRKVKRVIAHGLQILERANLVPNPASWLAADDLGLDIDWCDEPAELDDPPKLAKWLDWRLVIDGHEYQGRFHSQAEWEEYYS